MKLKGNMYVQSVRIKAVSCITMYNARTDDLSDLPWLLGRNVAGSIPDCVIGVFP
jgi:hypothetical protein